MNLDNPNLPYLDDWFCVVHGARGGGNRCRLKKFMPQIADCHMIEVWMVRKDQSPDLKEVLSNLTPKQMEELGEVYWLYPDTQEHLRGTLWSGPPTNSKGHPVLVVRL